MSVVLNDERTQPKRRQIHNHRDAISRSHDRTPDRSRAIQMVEEEETFDVKLALTLAYLATAPLILYVILRWFLSAE